MIGSIAVLAAVTLERLAELALAARNTGRLKVRGAIEHSPGHYPFMVALHVAWLAGLWWLAWDRPLHWGWLAVFGLLQILRVWVLVTLKGRWTTRIITLPGETLIRRGPYRLMRHPNYLVVVCEIAVLPLAFSLPQFAAVFTLANVILIAIRVRAEEAALDRASGAAARR
ncbi:MAG TPA: isoprenylcysteine carboxylmethyltransferase family protein [Caulobacteraceae bacterium]